MSHSQKVTKMLLSLMHTEKEQTSKNVNDNKARKIIHY